MREALFAALMIFGFIPNGMAAIRFTCVDAQQDPVHRAVFTGTIRQGFEKHALHVVAELDSLLLFEAGKLKLSSEIKQMQGEGFVTEAGVRQFDLSSAAEGKRDEVNLQLSLNPDAHDVISYLTVNDIRYRAHCEKMKPQPVPGLAKH